MTKHTEGEWTAQFTTPTESGMAIYIALPGGAVTFEDERLANAALIAAAPDLLNALKHAVNWHDQLTPKDIARYKEAIAKAEGK